MLVDSFKEVQKFKKYIWKLEGTGAPVPHRY